MKHYSIIPNDWDYTHSKEIKELNDKGMWIPCMVPEVDKHCGSLFPFIITKSNAIKYVKNLKAKFPFVIFDLMEGETWGELKLVQSF